MERKTRVRADDVARILSVIASPPNRRKKPLAGDMEGEFDEWFDGGAVRFITGKTEYHFSDGTRAAVGVFDYLAVIIIFSNGDTVEVTQTRES